MGALALWAALRGALWGGFAMLFSHEVRLAEKATHGTCAIVSNTDVAGDVRPHLLGGELLLPVKRFGGDHQIVCIPRALQSRHEAKARLKVLADDVFASTVVRECHDAYLDDPYMERDCVRTYHVKVVHQ